MKEQETLQVPENKNDSQQVPGTWLEDLEDHDSQNVLIREWVEDGGIVPKNEDYQRYCSVSSHGLLRYYAMRQEEEEDDAIWEALIVQGGLFFRKC